MTVEPIADAGIPADEAAFVARLRAGENDAFNELVAACGGRMLAVARRIMASDEDAQDAVQDAFVSALRSLDRFDGRSRISTWLHRITVNCCLMRLRSRSRRPERPIEDFLPAFLEDGHQATPSRAWESPALSAMSNRETAVLVREKIDALPEQHRVVLVLRDVEGLSTEEAAAALGLTANAVKTRLHRARQALRGLLDPHFRSEESSR